MATKYLNDYEFEYARDKTKIFRSYCDTTFIRLQSMFVYKGLPDSIPVQWLENYLLKNGSCVIAEEKGILYALAGNAGGDLDVYYQPTQYTVANPALSLSKTYTIGKDCVYCKNDYIGCGLTPLVSRYCGLMTENFITTRLADINMRMMNLLSASDDKTQASAKQYIKDIEEGKLGVIGEAPFFDGIKLQSNSAGSGDYIVQFIELQQYIKGSLFNELGLDANYNMKREALSADEIALNDDALMPLIDEMLKERREMCSKIEEMFGVHIEVDYGSSWHANSVEKTEAAQEELGADSDVAANMTDETSLDSDTDANDSADNDLRTAVDEEAGESKAEVVDKDASQLEEPSSDEVASVVEGSEDEPEDADDTSESSSSESDTDDVSDDKTEDTESDKKDASDTSDEDGKSDDDTGDGESDDDDEKKKKKGKGC